MSVTLEKGIPIASTSMMSFNGSPNHILYYPRSFPHSLIVGRTGSGKSYAARYWMYQFLNYYPSAKLYLLDFKNEFNFPQLPRYYTNFDCVQGMKSFVQEMGERQESHNVDKPPILLYIDELSALLTFLDKKDAETFRHGISLAYMVSRAQNMFTLTGMQRADASNWVAGARDNISFVMLLGEFSKEGCEMFSLKKENMGACPYPGMGHILINGNSNSLLKIKIPFLRDTQKIDRRIIEALS